MSQVLQNPLDFPLVGSRLIEASAGTGKTYTIAALYVRLVIGMRADSQTNAGLEAPLLPRNILVMTFTKAATEELSDRIRARLSEAARYFRDVESAPSDPFLKHLRAACESKGESLNYLARLLELASESMDEAAVKTIHGWCQSMLKEHAFASGSLFTQHVETDDEELRRQAAEDYFRRFIYQSDSATQVALLAVFDTPDKIMAQLSRVDDAGTARVEDDIAEQLRVATQRYQSELNSLKQHSCSAFERLLADLEGVKGVAQKTKQIQKFVDWCASDAQTDVKFTEANWRTISENDLQTLHEKKLAGAELPGYWLEVAQFRAQFEAVHQVKRGFDELINRHATHWVSARFSALQSQRAEMNHDDMLTRLRDALRGPDGEQLATTIRQQYPIALVDEFQDTDPVQYEIFNRIYRLKEPLPDTGIFLIGDPKQAIYSFRNADIFTYLKARRDTAGRHYSLATNFRSSTQMVQAVNHLFERAEQSDRGAFLFKRADDNELPFEPVSANGVKTTFRHRLRSQQLAQAPALYWSVSAEQKRKKSTAFSHLANHHAQLIVNLLNDAQAGYYDDKGALQQRVCAKDIAILVNNFAEADAIRTALSVRGVKSVYLSERESVYAQPVARDLLYILKACAAPRNASTLKTAVAAPLLNLSLAELIRLQEDENTWERTVDTFIDFHEVWRSQGVLAMLHRLMHHFQVPATLLQDKINGERKLADVLHIAELLQQSSMALEGMAALVNDFAEKVYERQSFGANSRTQRDEQQLRLESDDDLVKVITIHKSKGLQYPLVFLPFITYTPQEQYRIKPPMTYHDEQGEVQVLWSKDDSAKSRVLDELLAEDLRKLYVAVTRAQHATFIAVENVGQFEHNPLAYLLGDDALTDDLYKAASEAWGQTGVSVVSKLEDDEPLEALHEQTAEHRALAAREMPRTQLLERWWVSSYSALRYRAANEYTQSGPQTAVEMNLLEEANARTRETDIEAEEITYLPSHLHQFPKGATPGTLLHNLLEQCAIEGFSTVLAKPKLVSEVIERELRGEAWDEYREMLGHWLSHYLALPMVFSDSFQPTALADLKSYKAEPEFWLPVCELEAVKLDTLINQYIHPGQSRPGLESIQLNGMLKGFIDLVFEYQGQYFVVDYKSNWLGGSDDDYSETAMTDKILASRYDVQYVLYTLALHRQLKQRLGEEYHYDTHVGGIAYLFLRGNHAETAGVYRARPPYELIAELDVMFNGKEHHDVA
jgi:exodeoxyribonuclease V beta subunit